MITISRSSATRSRTAATWSVEFGLIRAGVGRSFHFLAVFCATRGAVRTW
jgi:hypothetical protein